MRYYETPSKKITRLVVWKRAKEILGSRFFTGSHLVLLSAEAGDVSTLLGLGVPASHIIGVDSDVHAVAAARHKFPDVRCIHGDVAEVATKLYDEGVKFVSVYLDFCGPLGEPTISKVAAITPYLMKNSVVAIGLKMGRERGEWAEQVNKAKSTVTVGSGTLYIRANILTLHLFGRGAAAKRYVVPIDFYRCSSKRATEEKSEMLVCVGQLNSKAPPSAKQVCQSAYYATIAADERSIGPLASLLASREEDAHLLLNLKSESIPAYKAHRTRGTYKGISTKVSRQKRRKS